VVLLLMPLLLLLMPSFFLQTLYESSVAFGMRKALMTEQGKGEMESHIGTMEGSIKDLERQVGQTLPESFFKQQQLRQQQQCGAAEDCCMASSVSTVRSRSSKCPLSVLSLFILDALDSCGLGTLLRRHVTLLESALLVCNTVHAMQCTLDAAQPALPYGIKGRALCCSAGRICYH
jgi:hypothetical protein